MKKYYVLAARENARSPYYAEFGAYEKSDVQFERDCMRTHKALCNMKILELPCAGNATLEIHMRKLNAEATEL